MSKHSLSPQNRQNMSRLTHSHPLEYHGNQKNKREKATRQIHFSEREKRQEIQYIPSEGRVRSRSPIRCPSRDVNSYIGRNERYELERQNRGQSQQSYAAADSHYLPYTVHSQPPIRESRVVTVDNRGHERHRSEAQERHNMGQTSRAHPTYRPLSYRNMKYLIELNANDIAMEIGINLNGQLDSTVRMVDKLDDGQLGLLLQILGKLSESDLEGCKDSVYYILQQSHFLESQHVFRYITKFKENNTDQFKDHITCVLSLVLAFLSSTKCTSQVQLIMIMARGIGVENDEACKSLIEAITTQCNMILSDITECSSFANAAVLPTSKELMETMNVDLKPIPQNNSFTGIMSYLDIHFQLLKEDIINPLRSGLQEYKKHLEKHGDQQFQHPDIRIYENARILEEALNKTEGLTHTVKFDVRKLKHSLQQNTSRLLFGSLLCFVSKDMKCIILGTIAERKAEDIIRGELQVNFDLDQTLTDISIMCKTKCVIVESTAYFEAYKHVLLGLQDFARAEQTQTENKRMPFQIYIVDGTTQIKSPLYLRSNTVTYDFTCLLDKTPDPDWNLDTMPTGKKNTFRKVQVCDSEAWPSKEDLKLDEAQWKSLFAAVNREFAVIQGPPGTGKTFLGLKLVTLLLANKHKWKGSVAKDRNSPILITCYTNHALDQFLEGILNTCFRTERMMGGNCIVRVGSKCKNEQLAQYNIRSLLRSQRGDQSTKRARQHLYKLYNDHNTTKQNMQLCDESIIHQSTLLHEGIITQEQSTYMMDNCDRRSWISMWLGIKGDRDILACAVQEVQNKQTNPIVVNPKGGQEKNGNRKRDEGNTECDVNMDDFENDVQEMNHRIITDHYQDLDEADEIGQGVFPAILVVSFKQLCTEYVPTEHDEYWNEISDSYRKFILDSIHCLLLTLSPMTEEEFKNIENPFDLHPCDRWRCYLFFIERYREILIKRLQTIRFEYQQASNRYKEAQLIQDEKVLRQAQIIGMTTTGAARYRGILQRIGPKIVIVEEAAEIFEAHTITTLSSGCEHLILIGDHQQLRPKPNVYELEKNFNLGRSLFERVIQNGLPYEHLVTQYRMRPEICKVLVPHIYPDLQNSPSVGCYNNIEGIDKNIFFVNHTETEEDIVESHSHCNKHEATFIVNLAIYLTQQGYKHSQITILTAYKGQERLIRNSMQDKGLVSDMENITHKPVHTRKYGYDHNKQITNNQPNNKQIKVTVVDNYQGEENDIILLSLVRSNKQKRIGFLSQANRVCVALSRAKKGFYVIGNFSLLSERSSLWKNITQSLKEDSCIANSLLLVCTNHDKCVHTIITKPEDFKLVPEGGCSQMCDFQFTCGHVCPRYCHKDNKHHTNVLCKVKCDKVPYQCNDQMKSHKCKKECWQACGDCMELVEKVITKCGHTQHVPCYQQPETFMCKMTCNKTIEICGHNCRKYCGQSCRKTNDCLTQITISHRCGHNTKEYCQDRKVAKCSQPCDSMLACSHKCTGTCSTCHQGRLHQSCTKPCERLLICMHKCDGKCSRSCPPCSRKCEQRCSHRRCRLLCEQPCIPCKEPCGWQCKHFKCTRMCYQKCNRQPCDEPCKERIKCGHRCSGLCGERCPTLCRTCDRDKLTEIFFGREDEPNAMYMQLHCGHCFEYRDLDYYMQMGEDEANGEVCVKMKECPKCRSIILPTGRYGNVVKKVLRHVDRIKRKIRGQEDNLQKRKTEIFHRILDNHYHLLDWLDGNLSSELLDSVENKLNLFAKIEQIKRETPSKAINIDKQIDEVRDWLLEQRGILTDQQVSQYQHELQRLALLVHYTMIKERLTDNKDLNLDVEKTDLLEKAYQMLTSGGELTTEIGYIVKKMLADINKLLPKTGLGISMEEKVMIVKAMDFQRQGHWYKCPKGKINHFAIKMFWIIDGIFGGEMLINNNGLVLMMVISLAGYKLLDSYLGVPVSKYTSTSNIRNV